jgi:hypothetical protein
VVEERIAEVRWRLQRYGESRSAIGF